MSSVRWDIGRGAAVAVSLAWFFDDTGLFAACVPAVLAHEAGHVLALRLCGAHIRRVSVRISGARIDYSGVLPASRRAAALAAGPAMGAAWALFAWAFLGGFGRLSALASLVLTLFNSLPALPLDGGALVECLWGRERARRVSVLASAALLAASLVPLARFGAAVPAIAAAALLVYNMLPEPGRAEI